MLEAQTLMKSHEQFVCVLYSTPKKNTNRSSVLVGFPMPHFYSMLIFQCYI